MAHSVLITGASTGIGFELAKLFAQDHYDVILVARSKDKLERLAHELTQQHNISATVIEKDLSLPNVACEIYSEVQAAGMSIDILVNNAGTGIYGDFSESVLGAQLNALQLNIMTLTALTHLFLPGIKERKGKILNVSSTAAFQPGPLMACYFASKAYVLSFSEALANELRRTGVTVTVLCPGPTSTNFQARTGTEDIRESAMMMDAALVAQKGYRGLMQGRTVVVPGIINKILVFIVRFLPRDFATNAARYFEEKVSG